MRNPKNSWDKSDTTQCCGCDKDCASINNKLCVGNADLKLMETLGAAGTDHGKYLRMITVTADITAPLYWWKEYDTYKVGTVANSCSTIHNCLPPICLRCPGGRLWFQTCLSSFILIQVYQDISLLSRYFLKFFQTFSPRPAALPVVQAVPVILRTDPRRGI